MVQNSLTIPQKTLVVGFAAALIGEESSNFFSLLTEVMSDIGLSPSEFANNIQDVSSTMSLYGVYAFAQFKNTPQSDKELIKRVLGKALRGGVNYGNSMVTSLYESGISQFMSVPVSAKIQLHSSVNSITRVAAYHLSGSIENGLKLANSNQATIYNDHIDFGKCNNPIYKGQRSGNIAPNFFVEFGKVVYRFGGNLKCGMLNKQIDFCGFLPPTCPDNESIFNLIYPRFA